MEATRKLISKSGEVFASPVTYLASYVIPTEKRTAGELHTLNEILKLSGAGGSGEKTKGDAASNESNAVLGLPSALLWSGNVLHANTHDRGNNPNNSGNEGKGNTTITQTLDRMWTVLDEHGRAKNLKASKAHVAAAFGVPLRDLHYLDPLRPTLTPANIFIRPKCLIVNLEHMKFIVTAEIALFLNAESLEVKRFVKFLRKYLKEVEIAQTQKREDLVKEATMMETIIRDENENETQKLQQSNSALKNAQTTTKIKEERVLHLPFELLVLECAMHELGLVLDNETIALEREAAPCMEKMLQSVQAEELAEGRRIKEKLNALILRLEAFTEAISSILEHDESLDAMCLSKLKVMELVRGDDISTTAAPDDDNENESAPRMGAAATAQTTTTKKSSKKAQFITRVISNPTGMTMNEEKEYDPENEEEFETIDSTNEEDGHEHEGAEALLEAYFMHSAATQKRAHALKDLLQNTEAVSSMILDRQRNELIKIDLVVSAALFACSIVSVAGSIFGMNLQSNLETKSGFFVGVIVVTSALAAASFLFIIFYCSRKNLFKL
jgi:magnesium transporter